MERVVPKVFGMFPLGSLAQPRGMVGILQALNSEF
jgi:hypothetical protein